MKSNTSALISQILIKEWPKNIYPLLSIDKLVDGTSENQIMSMMDAYFGYNQILMYRPYEEITSFNNTHSGTYWEKDMSFGLRNVGATF